jgi:hypothetical protein
MDALMDSYANAKDHSSPLDIHPVAGRIGAAGSITPMSIDGRSSRIVNEIKS